MRFAPLHDTRIRATRPSRARLGLVPTLLCALAGGAAGLSAQALTEPEASVFLVGDGGEVNDHRSAVLTHLANQVDELARLSPTTAISVLFLGDNVYDEGIRPHARSDDESILVEQVLLGGSRATPPTVFVPGNHDWGNGGPEPEGVRRLALLDTAITRISEGDGRRAVLSPRPGCPGPELVEAGPGFGILAIDTEWLIRDAGERTCAGLGRQDFLDSLAATVEGWGDGPLIIAAHHPLASAGEHGGYAGADGFGGTLRRWAAGLGIVNQDIPAHAYASMVEEVTAALAGASGPVVWAAGHEHNLQVIADPSSPAGVLTVVSGSAAKSSPVGSIPGLRYGSGGYGYVRIDARGGELRLTVWEPEDVDSPSGLTWSCTLPGCDDGRGPS